MGGLGGSCFFTLSLPMLSFWYVHRSGILNVGILTVIAPVIEICPAPRLDQRRLHAHRLHAYRGTFAAQPSDAVPVHLRVHCAVCVYVGSDSGGTGVCAGRGFYLRGNDICVDGLGNSSIQK